MNLYDLDNIIDELESSSDSLEKTASAGASLEQEVDHVLRGLSQAELSSGGGDFYEQYNLMEKKASVYARQMLGIDSNEHGTVSPGELALIAPIFMGGK